MDVYVAHSTGWDFKNGLYRPIRASQLDNAHNIVLPHESEGLFDSKTFFEEDCDLVIAEVSEPSTGQGIELGWADMYNVPIAAVCRSEKSPSSALQAVTNEVRTYRCPEELLWLIDIAIGTVKEN